MRNHTLADAYTYKEEDTLQQGFEDWLLGVIKNDFNETQLAPKIKGEGGSIKLDWTGQDNTAVYLKSQEIPKIVEGIKGKTTFTVDGTRFKFLNNQWVWDANGEFEPVTGAEGQNYNYEDGSNDALSYRLGNNKRIVEAFKNNELPVKKKKS